MPVCFGYLLCNPKNRSRSHTQILQPCNGTSSDSFGAYAQQPNWKTMRFDTIHPDCVKSQTFRIKLNSTKARKIQGYNMWSTKSINTESDSRFLEDEKKIMLCFLLAPKQKEKEVLRFLRKPLKLIGVSEASPKGRISWIKENHFAMDFYLKRPVAS